MTELATMAASKNTNSNNTNNISNQIPQQMIQQSNTVTQSLIQSQNQAQPNSPALSTASSLVSPDSSATNPQSSPEASVSGVQTPQNTPQTDSPETPLVPGVININSNLECGVEVSADDSLTNKSASTTPTNSSPTPVANTTTNIDNNSPPSGETNQNPPESPPKDLCIEPDIKSSGSVSEKASMFEKLEQQQAADLQKNPFSTSSTSLNIIPQAITLPQTLNNNLTPATVARLESIYGKKPDEVYGKATVQLVHVDRDAG